MMKPDIEAFRTAVEKYGGNLTKVAEAFNTSRTNLYKWLKADENYQMVVDDARGKMFDECLSTARVLALGVANVEGGKIVGWAEKPDGNMLRYLLGTLGKKEGFGESIDVTTNGKDIMGANMFRVLTREEMSNFNEQFDKDF